MRILRTALLLPLIFGAAIPAHAQSYLSPKPERHAYEDRFRLEVDILYGRYDTQMRLDNVVPLIVGGAPVVVNGVPQNTVKPGTVVSGEQDFGLASSQVLGQVELTLLPGRHHMVRLNALSMRRDAHQVLTRDVSWDNDVFLTGETVDSHLNLSFIGLTYGYLPFRTDNYELGVSFGVQIASVSANAEVRSKGIRSAETGAGPVPMFGLEGRYDFSKRWSVDARWQSLSLSWFKSLGVGEANNTQATISDGRFALCWRQNPHLNYGLGYRFFKLSVLSPDPSSTDNPSLNDSVGAITLNLTGPVLFVQASL